MVQPTLTNGLSLGLFCFGYLALSCMALAMFSHFRASFNRTPSLIQSRGLYGCGWLVLLISYSVNIQYLGFAYGSILFVGLLSLAGLLVILTASYRPHYFPHLMLAVTAMGTGLLLSY
ncbi:DUF3325 domain-containing protein [Shewanella waksmanii]|uniref:DUF3325 domain-containing protein n=1 Tax=Shewanella waksmanii TaxID=213783 RepID=UPI0004B7B19D|nr:DUF3325 domain-containing protein [Shewanella waksmanii]